MATINIVNDLGTCGGSTYTPAKHEGRENVQAENLPDVVRLFRKRKQTGTGTRTTDATVPKVLTNEGQE